MTSVDENAMLLQWMQRIDSRLESIDDHLDAKVDKTDHQTLQDRVSSVETKTHNLAIKLAGIASVMSIVGVWVKSQFFG